MFRKVIMLALGFALLSGALLATPFIAHAGGSCGGTYIADPGDTLASIAATCGTTVEAIRAANPGITEPLKTGQSLTVPGLSYVTPVTAVPTTVVPATPVVVNNVYNYYNYYNYYPTTNYTGTYIVQYGDTFASIASRFGVGLYDLWAANPQIWDINMIYVGQLIYVPASSPWVVVVTPTAQPVPLSWSNTTTDFRKGTVLLSNQANGDVYVSLRTTLPDGSSAINEYPVSGTFDVKIAVGWVDYVAWVGGVKFTGGFHLSGETDRTVTFFKNKVIVE